MVMPFGCFLAVFLVGFLGPGGRGVLLAVEWEYRSLEDLGFVRGFQ